MLVQCVMLTEPMHFAAVHRRIQTLEILRLELLFTFKN